MVIVEKGKLIIKGEESDYSKNVIDQFNNSIGGVTPAIAGAIREYNNSDRLMKDAIILASVLFAPVEESNINVVKLIHNGYLIGQFNVTEIKFKHGQTISMTAVNINMDLNIKFNDYKREGNVYSVYV